MTRSISLVVRASLLLLVASRATQVVSAQPSTGTAGDSQVHSIELPRFQSNLPEAPGREAFAAACLSCHSTTYITMQPPLSAAKWEESVIKMTKVYAAPIAAEQIPQIVQYLMATKEAGSREMQETRTLTPPSNSAAPVMLARDAERRKADLKRGEALFATNCASCHGATGAGDGPSAPSQFPHPTNLKATRFSTAALTAAVTRGVPATAMPGYPDLPADDLRAIVMFSQQLFDAAAHQPSAPPSVADQAQAKSLYAQNCAACHGATGAGDGPLAATAPRPPANFRSIQPARSTAAQIIADGVPATTMPPWKPKFNDVQRDLLAEYVRSFYTSDEQRGTADPGAR
jgi:mono/diheme cytochrome c family protein